MTAYKIQGDKKAQEQQDLLDFTTWLKAQGLYDFTATLSAATDLEPQPGPSRRPVLRVVYKK